LQPRHAAPTPFRFIWNGAWPTRQLQPYIAPKGPVNVATPTFNRRLQRLA
jgi:hypothetical protein